MLRMGCPAWNAYVDYSLAEDTKCHMDILLHVFYASIAYQVVLYGYLIYQLHWHARQKKSFFKTEHSVSVIVCAHNEYHNLQELLPLLFQQVYHQYEIIVVDDTSEDSTQEWLKALQTQQPLLKVITISVRSSHMQAKKYALTLGIEAARFDQILLTDADCRPASDRWLALMSQQFDENTQFVLGYSPYYAQPGLLNTFIRYETMHTGLLYLGAAAAGFPYMGVGRNLAYRKSLFIYKKGFGPHQRVVGGDDDLWVNRFATRENTRLVIDPDARMFSIPEQYWSDYIRQKTRHLSVGKYYKRCDRLVLGLLSLTSVLIWILGITLAIACKDCQVIVILFVARWVILAILWAVVGRTLQDSINLLILPILDFLHVIYYTAIGAKALSSSNIQWTKKKNSFQKRR